MTGPNGEDYSWLAEALDVGSALEAARDHVHGFHSYPARLHPVTAGRIVRGLCRPEETVLDPFCGSGTVLIEANLAGLAGIGVDANPLAVELSRLKLRGADEAQRRQLCESAERIVDFAEARRKARAGATRRYARVDVDLFEPHVLLELDGLRAGISRLDHTQTRQALFLVLSSILTKVSRQAGDSSERVLPNRHASGYALRLFRDKAKELGRRLEDYRVLLGEGADRRGAKSLPPFEVRSGDARDLSFLTAGSVHAIVTSPPYPGTYDYLAHHATRLRWLGMDPRFFEQTEIGARRNLDAKSTSSALEQWRSELSASLVAMARVLSPNGTIVLVLADSVVHTTALFADDVTAALAPKAGLRVAAVASQLRPHFHRASQKAFARRPRREHAIVLLPKSR